MLKSIPNYRVEFIDDLFINGKPLDAYLSEPSRIFYLDSKISFERRTHFLNQVRALVLNHSSTNNQRSQSNAKKH